MKEQIVPEQAQQLIARTREELIDVVRQRQILELVETVLIYKFPNLSGQEVEQILGLNELRQTRVYQEALEEGRQEGELAVILRLLTRRLGTIAPELRSQLQQLSSSQLEELAEALLDFFTTADLVTWLET